MMEKVGEDQAAALLQACGGEQASVSDKELTSGEPASPRNDTKRKRASEEPLPSNDDEPKIGGNGAEHRSSSDGPGSKRSKPNLLSQIQPTASPPKIHGLPPLLWRRIFSLLPPVFLGRLLRVSRGFNSLLTSDAAAEESSTSQAPLSVQSVWLASRQRYASGLPQGLPDQSELDMWRLIRGSSCQLCKKKMPLLTTNNLSDPWRPHPEDGLRVIWPFGVRCCMQCLEDRIEQESSLLFSSVPSFLLPALPYIFLCEGKHYVHSYTVKNSTYPQDVLLSKVYYKPFIESLKDQFHRFKTENPDTAKSWVEKLEKENEMRAERVLRWELWETKGGLKKVNVRPGARRSSAPRQALGQALPPSKTPANIASSHSHEPPPPTIDVSQISTVRDSNGLMYASLAPSQESIYYNAPPASEALPPQPNIASAYPNPSAFPAPTAHPVAAAYSYSSSFVNSAAPAAPAAHRPERNLRDVTEAKAERKAEIERRCMELDPPILPNILCLMDSFQAALQIPQPLTENAWELLKPRLLDQREEAEKEEHQRLAQDNTMQDLAREQVQKAAPVQEDSETRDRAWDASQAPIRDRLSIYADEQIRYRWANGTAVNKETCATFAADILLYVKRRFDEDHQQSRNFAGTTNAEDDSTSASADNILILENMKWVFDNKIRPLTEPYQREIFLCSICEGSSKYYGFEAVIQHYAAKHTTALSQGSVVVHWRAKWPDQAPFHPNPGLAQSSYPSSTSASYGSQGAAQAPVHYAISQAAPFLEHAAPWIQNATGAYAPPQSEQAFPGYHPPQYPNPVGPSYPNQYSGMPTGPTPLNNPYQAPNQVPQYLAPPHGSSPVQPMQAPGQWPQYSSPTAAAPQAALPVTQMYQAQMNDMAKHAREIWFATGGVRDMPPSVRIFVVIQHIAMRLANLYTGEFTLTMFLDGLNQNAQMRPVRSLNGLICRTCNAQGVQSHHPNFRQGSDSGGDRKQYTLPLLLNHFKSVHLEGTQNSYGWPPGPESTQLDWKRDMIELPEPSVLLSLINAYGMDNGKLALIAQVFPGVYPNPLPKAGTYKPTASTTDPSRLFSQNNQQGLTAEENYWNAQRSRISRDRVSPVRSNGSRNERRSHSSTREWEPAGEDEYDPHRPAYLGRVMDSHRIPQPDRPSPAAEQYLEPGPDDYDPTQPMIDYDTNQRSSRLHRRPPKIEVVEADHFLDQLQPQIEQSRRRYPVDQSRSGRHDESYPLSGGSGHSGEGRSHDSRADYSGRDAYEPPRSARYYEAPEPHLRRSPREHSASGRRYEEWTTYVSPGPDGPSPHGPQRNDIDDVPREPTSQPTVRYVADSRSSGYHSPREQYSSHLQYVYPSSASYGPEAEGHERDRARAVEYIPVEDYRRDTRYAQHSSAGPLSARAYVVEADSEPMRWRNEGNAYEEVSYTSRAGRTEPEGRVVYREYR